MSSDGKPAFVRSLYKLGDKSPLSTWTLAPQKCPNRECLSSEAGFVCVCSMYHGWNVWFQKESWSLVFKKNSGGLCLCSVNFLIVVIGSKVQSWLHVLSKPVAWVNSRILTRSKGNNTWSWWEQDQRLQALVCLWLFSYLLTSVATLEALAQNRQFDQCDQIPASIREYFLGKINF